MMFCPHGFSKLHLFSVLKSFVAKIMKIVIILSYLRGDEMIGGDRRTFIQELLCLDLMASCSFIIYLFFF